MFLILSNILKIRDAICFLSKRGLSSIFEAPGHFPLLVQNCSIAEMWLQEIPLDHSLSIIVRVPLGQKYLFIGIFSESSQLGAIMLSLIMG